MVEQHTWVNPTRISFVGSHFLSSSFRNIAPYRLIQRGIWRTPAAVSRSFRIMNPRSAKRSKSSGTSVRGSTKRMRQSTLSFGQLTSNNEGWEENTSGVMVFETKDWYEKAKAGDEPRAVAAFDLDSTLIKTKSGAKFPRTPTDLVLWNAAVLPKLQQCDKEGFVIVIFSNQNGISSGRTPREFIRPRVLEVVNALNLPIAVYLASQKDWFRKPSIGMWEQFVNRIGGKDRVNTSRSFFVGDAAGRRQDFSNSDLKFALNLDLPFHTPENYFLGETYNPSALSLDDFNPRNYVTEGAFNMLEAADQKQTKQLLESIIRPKEMVEKVMKGFVLGEDSRPETQCLLLLNGSPASGKTTFAKRYLVKNGYTWINHDSSTQSKGMKLARETLSAGQSVVVDNTNGTRTARGKYLQIANNNDSKVMKYCLRMQTQKELAKHLNVVREVKSKGQLRRVPDVAFNTYYKRASVPTEEEGLDAIGVVEFKAHFADADEKFVFTRHS